MPDWFYRTVSQPILFRLPAERARNFALGFMGTLARLPAGPAVIDFMGHMRADSRLSRSFTLPTGSGEPYPITFPTSVGLGPALDGEGRALPALARFGIGFLGVGPFVVEPPPLHSMQRQDDQQALWIPGGWVYSLSERKRRVVEASSLGLPLLVRLGAVRGKDPKKISEECLHVLGEIGIAAHLFTLGTLEEARRADWSKEQWGSHVQAVLEGASHLPQPRPVLLCLPADLDEPEHERWVEPALSAGIGGLLLDGSVPTRDEGNLVGEPNREAVLQQVQAIRQRWGSELFVIASGGIHEPEDALAFRHAGADLVQIDTGLIYTGPGLPKRINEVLLYHATRTTESPRENAPRPPEMTWFWTTLMGSGMLLGSVLALIIAATRVVMPYDESFVGMTPTELEEINPRLVLFMAHDRVSLAGTMVAIGVLYVGLSWYGVRRGLHWAQQTLFISAFTGFFSFFLFLGFGYLDPLHAFVTAVLFQFLLLAVHCRLGSYHPQTLPPLRGDAVWRWSLWGQLILVLHGVALLTAGLVISTIGVTHVFVPEDLDFMQTTAETLRSANPRLIPLVAHDRATLGGMLLASGWVFLLPALWGFRTGSAWLWWSTLIAGVSAYAAAIGVHYVVGYTNWRHLAPAYGGLAWFLLGLMLARPFLCATGEKQEGEWKRWLSGGSK